MRIRTSWVTALCALLILQVHSAHAQSSEPFRFVHLTDTHLATAGGTDPMKKLSADIDAMPVKPAFVVDTGDADENAPLERLAVGGSSIPVYRAPGRRELSGSTDAKGARKSYQSFDHNGCHFVLLDSTIPLERLGHLDAAQLKWLEADLKKLKKDMPVFLFIHHPVGREKELVDNEEALLRLIAPYNVIALMTGHSQTDTHWKVNGIECVTARGLSQGSYNLVEIDDKEVRILRARKEDSAPKSVARIPRAAGPYRHAEFLWGDPNLPLLARRRPLVELQVGKSGAHDERVKAAYSLDGGEPKPMERDVRDRESVSFMTEFPTKGLGNGAHRLRFFLTESTGDVYRRDEPFVVEQLSGQPKRLWEEPFKTGEAVQSSPALADGMLYVGSLDGKLYAIDVKNGNRRWIASTKGIRVSSPVVVEGTVYVGSADGLFYAFDAKNGRQRWAYDAGAPVVSSAAVSNGVACFGIDKRIVGVDVATGKERWSQPAEGPFQSRAATDGTAFYLSGGTGTLYALDAATGRPRWNRKIGSDGGRGAASYKLLPMMSSPAVGEGRVYVSANGGTLHAMNAATGKDDWTARAPTSGEGLGYTSPLVANGRVYAGGLGTSGECFAFDAKTGASVWRCATGAENYHSSPTIAGGMVVISSLQGKLSWIDAVSGTLRYQYALDPGFCFSTPVSTEKVTYMPSMNGTVYAIGLP